MALIPQYLSLYFLSLEVSTSMTKKIVTHFIILKNDTSQILSLPVLSFDLMMLFIVFLPSSARSILGSGTEFSCHVFSAPLSLVWNIFMAWILWHWHLWKITSLSHKEQNVPLFWVSVSSWLDLVYAFSTEILQKGYCILLMVTLL